MAAVTASTSVASMSSSSACHCGATLRVATASLGQTATTTTRRWTSFSSSASSSFVLLKLSPKRLRRSLLAQPPCAMAASDGNPGGKKGGSAPRPFEFETIECPVPQEQRPVREYEALREAQLFTWATLQLPAYSLRLLAVWAIFFFAVGCPIAGYTFKPTIQPVEFALAGGSSALFIVTVAVLRLYLGWSYVGNRLFSATVEYEETGWYDGQIWVKPPEVLARDRLLGFYQVKPTLERLKLTLVGLGSGVTVLAMALAFLLVQDANATAEEPQRYPASYSRAYSEAAARTYEKLDEEEVVMISNTEAPDYCR
eukprot:jgi/Chlat1/1204/Chrsp115S01668